MGQIVVRKYRNRCYFGHINCNSWYSCYGYIWPINSHAFEYTATSFYLHISLLNWSWYSYLQLKTSSHHKMHPYTVTFGNITHFDKQISTIWHTYYTWNQQKWKTIFEYSASVSAFCAAKIHDNNYNCYTYNNHNKLYNIFHCRNFF